MSDGIVALSGLHPDGCEVLLGLLGPGHVIGPLSAPTRWLAHTDVIIEPAPMAWTAAQIVEALSARLQLQEAWSTAQGCVHLPDRVMALLMILAAQFGRPCPDGTLVDVRLTHTLIASAAGASRSAVTRALGALARRHQLLTVGIGEFQRYCLAGDHQVDISGNLSRDSDGTSRKETR